MSASCLSRSIQDEVLPSGRSVVLRINGAKEELEVRSPTGEVELVVTFGEHGPELRLRAARLDLEAVETLAVDFGRFEVRTGELSVQAEGDIDLKGKVIRLN
jgi:hypothetical protein